MRNAMLALTLIALGSTVARAQVGDDWAKKLFKEVSHDFGSVPRGAELSYKFPIKNLYAVRLEIMDVRVSCGCVTAKPSSRVLEPLQTAYLDVTMDARRFTGPKTVSIFFTVGPQYTSTCVLQVSAVSRADVVFNPGQINFGIVPRGQTPPQTIDVEYAGVLDWRINEVIKNGLPVDIGLEELYRRPGAVGYRVRITLRADAPPGPIKQDFLLKTNDAATPLLPVLVEGMVQAPLTAVPATVSVGTPKVGEAVTRKVVVRGSRPFRVTAIDGLGNDIKADLPGVPAPVQIVVLKYQASKGGDFHRQLLIKTDLAGEQPVTVMIEGMVTP